MQEKVDIRLPGETNSNSHGARPVYLFLLMIKWTRTKRLSIKNSRYAGECTDGEAQLALAPPQDYLHPLSLSFPVSLSPISPSLAGPPTLLRTLSTEFLVWDCLGLS